MRIFTVQYNSSSALAGNGGCLTVLPHGPLIVVVKVLYVCVGAGGAVVGVAHGVLVHGGVGLGRGVEGWRHAVAGLAAVVAVPVVYRTVWIVVCARGLGGEGCGEWVSSQVRAGQIYLYSIFAKQLCPSSGQGGVERGCM